MKLTWPKFSVIAFVVLVLDQWSKFWAVSALTSAFTGATSFADKLGLFQSVKHPAPVRVIPVVDDFWHYRYAENTGAAFSFLADADPSWRVPFFFIVAIIAMFAILWYYKNSRPEDFVFRCSLALVFGGAVGNLIDRVRLGYVIDFISWHWYDKAAWPTFNIADAGISVGIVLIFISSIGTDRYGNKIGDAKEKIHVDL